MPDVAARIFISYSRVDTDFVDKLQADLQSRNFYTWVDRRKLEAGHNWADDIQRAIDGCNVMVVVLSPDATVSDWVKKEYIYALNQKKIRIIPILHRQIKNMPIGLNDLQNIEFLDNYEQGFRNLLNVLTPVPIQTGSFAPSTSNAEAMDVEINKPNPSTPSTDLFTRYRAGVEANFNNDLDRAEILWKQVLESDPHYRDGLLQNEYDKLLKKLHPIRLQRLREIAQSATQEQDWQTAASAWKKYLELDTSDAKAREGLLNALRNQAYQARREGNWENEFGAWEAVKKIESNDPAAAERMPIAKLNNLWVDTYNSAKEFIRVENFRAAQFELEQLWSRAPFYEDTAELAAIVGIPAPLSPEEKKAKEQKEQREEEERRAEEEKRRAEEQREEEEKWSRELKEVAKRRAEEERKRTRPYYNENVLRFNSVNIFIIIFLSLVGGGILTGLYSQSWVIALAATGGIGIVFYLLSLHKSLSFVWFVVLLVLTGISVTLLVIPLTGIHTDQHSIDQLWLFGKHDLWIGRQITFGVVLGAIAGLIWGNFVGIPITSGDIDGFDSWLATVAILIFIIGSLILWPLIAIFAAIFNGGWGYGDGWQLSILVGYFPSAILAVGLDLTLWIAFTARPK